MACDKTEGLGEVQLKNHGNTYEITIRPQDRLIVTLQPYEGEKSIKTVTFIHHIGITVETSIDGMRRFISDWSFHDVEK